MSNIKIGSIVEHQEFCERYEVSELYKDFASISIIGRDEESDHLQGVSYSFIVDLEKLELIANPKFFIGDYVDILTYSGDYFGEGIITDYKYSSFKSGESTFEYHIENEENKGKIWVWEIGLRFTLNPHCD